MGERCNEGKPSDHCDIKAWENKEPGKVFSEFNVSRSRGRRGCLQCPEYAGILHRGGVEIQESLLVMGRRQVLVQKTKSPVHAGSRGLLPLVVTQTYLG